MKKLILVTAVLLLLAGAGFGGWWLLLRDTGSHADGAVAKQPPGFVTLPAMTIPVIHEDRVSRVFTLQITLEIVGGQDGIAADLPRLVDAFLLELHGLLGRRLMAERGYDLGLMKHRLQAAAARVLGPDRVTDILIRSMDQR